MKRQQNIVIFSPSAFTRSGLEGLFENLPGYHLQASVDTLPEVFKVCTQDDILMLHVTLGVSDDDWWCFDTAFYLWGPPCRIVILYDPECTSALVKMPHLSVQADAVLGSAVTQHALVACLHRVMI